jgi:hypothetical protein
MISLLVALILLGQADDDTSNEGPPGTNVVICHGPPPSCPPPAFQRAISVKTIVDVPSCPECLKVPAEEDIFPECLLVDAIPVPLRDEIMPDVLDLRAFARFQNRLWKRHWYASGRQHRFVDLGTITGQWHLNPRGADPYKVMYRWVRLYIYPQRPPSLWCDFDRDDYVGYEDWLEFFERSVWSEE